jgi:hypothetical protein
MNITVKIRFGTSKSKLEDFGNNRFLVYLISQAGEAGSMAELKELLSRRLAMPPEKIEFVGKNNVGDFVFEF